MNDDILAGVSTQTNLSPVYFVTNCLGNAQEIGEMREDGVCLYRPCVDGDKTEGVPRVVFPLFLMEPPPSRLSPSPN